MAEASATREAGALWVAGLSSPGFSPQEAETVKHRLQQACPFVASWQRNGSSMHDAQAFWALKLVLSKAVNSKMPLRPPPMLNCGMGLKRQEMDHSKRKTKARDLSSWSHALHACYKRGPEEHAGNALA